MSAVRVVRCPECRAVVPPAESTVRTCSYCGAQLEVEATPTPDTAGPGPGPGARHALAFVGLAVLITAVVMTVLHGRPQKASAPASKARVIPGARRVQEAQARAERPELVTTATFEHHRTLVDGNGGVQILGVVTNTSEVPINAPKVQVIFRDGAGAEVHSDARTADYDLAPGQRAPLHMHLLPPPAHESIAFEVVASRRRGLEPAEGLELAATNAVPGPLGWRVSGRVKNAGSMPARFVKVVASAWGPDDEVLAVSTSYVNDKRVEPGA